MRNRTTVLACAVVVASLSARALPVLAGEVVTDDETEVLVAPDGSFHIRDAATGATVTGDWRKVTAGVWGEADTDRILADLGAEIGSGQIRMQLSEGVLFDFGKATIRPDAATELGKIAHVIRQRATDRVTIVGHTDSVGADEQNQKLSEARATAVMRWLNGKESIPAELLEGRGMGARDPVAPNATPDGEDNPGGRAKNRRVEISIATTPKVAVPGVSVSAEGVTVGGIHIGTGGIGTGQAKPPAGEGSCASLCEATAGRHPMGTIGCVEGAFEELGYEMDSDSCDDLEDAMALGMGNAGGSLCDRCGREQGWTERDCASVQTRCFSSR